MSGKIGILPTLFVIIFGLSATSCQAPEEELVVAFSPSVESQTIINELDEFQARLSKDIGMKVRAVTMPNYGACIEAMGTGKADVAFLGPMAYVLGHDRYGIEAVLKVERKGKTVYRGEIIVRTDSGIESLEDLRGKNFAFVEPASASGSLYPKALFLDNGINSVTDFDNIIYPGKHNLVVTAVLSGQVAGGACFDDARELTLKSHPDVMEDTKIIAYTKDIPADTVSIRKDLDPEMKKKVIESLKLMADGTEGLLYRIYDVEFLHDALDSDFDPLRHVRDTLELKLEDVMD